MHSSLQRRRLRVSTFKLREYKRKGAFVICYVVVRGKFSIGNIWLLNFSL